MASIFCAEASGPIVHVPVEHEVWQVRTRRAGLSQRCLAKLAGVAENSISRQLRGHFGSGVPDYLKTIIRAWEMLTPEQRAALLRAVESGDDTA